MVVRHTDSRAVQNSCESRKQSEVWFEGSETQYDSWLDVRKQSEVELMQQLMQQRRVAADAAAEDGS